MVRTHDRRRRSKRSRQLWRHLRAAMRLVLRRPLVSVAVIPIQADGRIVLVRRVDTDQWVAPGGIIDWGETVEQAAERELDEETALELVEIERLVGVYSAPGRDPRGHSIAILVSARVSGDAEVQDPLELSEVHAFSPGEIPFEGLGYGMQDMIRDYLRGATVVR